MEKLDLPPVHEGLIDRATLEALLADIAGTTLRSITVRTGLTAAPPRGPEGFAEARAAILEGRLPSLQVRYVHEGREWCDTIMARPGGAWRVVRMQTPSAGE